MTTINTKRIRAKVACNLGPETARAANLSFSELSQFLAGSFFPSESALLDLAAFLKMSEKDVYR